MIVPIFIYSARTIDFRLQLAATRNRRRFRDEFKATIERDAAVAQAKREQFICSECRWPVTKEA